MARIPDEEIARIKKETDLVALVRSRGVELGKHGTKDWSGRCPFHTEDKASFIVSPEKGLFHCMGCGVAGNAIQFVERYDGDPRAPHQRALLGGRQRHGRQRYDQEQPSTHGHRPPAHRYLTRPSRRVRRTKVLRHVRSQD